MTISVSEIAGVSPDMAAKLKALGLGNSEQLLAAAVTPKQRQELADKVGVPPRAVLEWANRADLARIVGVGRVYSDLLEASGVDTVAELAQRKPENLLAKMTEVAPNHPVERLPRLSDVESWVKQAKDLGRTLQY